MPVFGSMPHRRGLTPWLERVIRLIRRHLVVRNGVGFIPQNTRPDGKSLNNRVRELRRRYARGRLSPATVAELESIPGWSWRVEGLRTNRYLRLLEGYVARHGWEPFHGGSVIEGERVGYWVTVNRGKYRRGEIGSRLRTKLESIPGWTWRIDTRGPFELALRERLDTLRRAWGLRRTGESPARPPVLSAKLRNLETRLRMRYRQGVLASWARKELEALPGWTWDRLADVRERHLRLLRQLARKHGGLPELTAKSIVNGHHIGAWLSFCWLKHRQGKLSPALEKELEAIPGWVWRRSVDDRHRRNLALLREFLEEHELVELSRVRFVKGVDLREWVSSRRVQFRHGRPQPEWLVRELDRLPHWSWNLRDEAPPSRRRPRYRQLRDSDR